jgi:hypothetical protein
MFTEQMKTFASFLKPDTLFQGPEPEKTPLMAGTRRFPKKS